MWRFRGTPSYLDAQAGRLGITQVLADRARNNPEIYRASVLLAQLCERYHKARKEDGKPVFGAVELAQIKGTLGQVELEVQKLHMLAGAVAAMHNEANAAFGFEPVKWLFELMADSDSQAHTLPLSNPGAPGSASNGHVDETTLITRAVEA